METFSSIDSFLHTKKSKSSSVRGLSRSDHSDIVMHTEIIRIPLSDVQPEETIDMTNFKANDLAKLRVEDPFMYYSAISRRSFADIDHQGPETFTDNYGCGAQSVGSRHSPLSFSTGSIVELQSPPSKIRRILVQKSDSSDECLPDGNHADNTNVVTRRRRFSTETHSSLILEEILMNNAPLSQDMVKAKALALGRNQDDAIRMESKEWWDICQFPSY